MDIFDLSENCITCPAKPCKKGCPLENDITDFIKEIKQGNLEEGFNVMSKTTVLMPICGRVCPHSKQCQGNCVRRKIDKSIEIGKVETLIGDMALEKGWNVTCPVETEFKVAVIGSGPAGLTCAAFLRRNGIRVTIYEKYDYLGGLLVHGIPEFRLPKKIVKKVIDNIIGLGIDVKYNMELGKNLSLDELKNNYDAVFIGIGANNSNKMGIHGEELNGVYGGNEVLEHNLRLDYEGKTVVVSGGGNVAMDVARTAIRNGAKKVVVVYRRSEKEMPASVEEIEEARKDGVEFLFQTNIINILGEGEVEKIEVVKTELVQKDGEERSSPVNVDGSNYLIECNYVMMAIGSHPDDFVEKLGIASHKGRLAIDENGMTSDEMVFAGGDIAGTKSTVAWAARAGRNAAYTIIQKSRKI